MSPSPIDTRSKLSAATYAGGVRRGGLIVSLLLYGALAAALFVTFAHKFDIVQEQSPVVPVDLVTIGTKTNITPEVKARPREKPVEDKPVDAPQPDKSEAAPQEVAKVEQPPPPPPVPDLMKPEPAPVTPPPSLELEKPKPQPDAKPKKEKFDVDSVLALLDKRAPSASSAPNARVGNRNIKGVGAQNAMTAELQDAMLSQIRQCWNPPVGAPRPEELIVEFELFLNQDGSVAQPPQLSADTQGAAAHDTYTRAAAEAARRAIYECAPYKLPADRFKEWHDITLTFDPRQMMGQ